MANILKFWHQWSWAYHICVSIVLMTSLIITYENATAQNTKDIADITAELTKENMSVRMAVQETTTQDINKKLEDIKNVQGKIFDRINQIVDRDHK